MRSDILVKIFAAAMLLSGLILAAIVIGLWTTFFGPFAAEYPILTLLGIAGFILICGPQIIGAILAWRFGSVARAMALDPAARASPHIALRIFMGTIGAVLLGVVGLSGVTLALDFGFSGICGIILLVLAAVGPQKIAGV